MNLALPDVSPEQLAAPRAQVQSLQKRLRESEADRKVREIRKATDAR